VHVAGLIPLAFPLITCYTLSVFIQLIIGLLGTLALFLTIKGKKLGCYIGLLGQPFWIWMSVTNKLWGVLVVSVAYFGVFLYGITKD
jgi:nicotinamide riboside transporter PnuC